MEESRPCADDPSSYALNYGEKNCLAYRNDLGSFSPRGQSFVLGTMMCLQDALRPAINCDAQCANLRAIAFNSHPGCYVDNGFCYLTCEDYWQVLMTIGGELRTLEAMVSRFPQKVMVSIRDVSKETTFREISNCLLRDTRLLTSFLDVGEGLSQSRPFVLPFKQGLNANISNRDKSPRQQGDALRTSERFCRTTIAWISLRGPSSTRPLSAPRSPCS